MDAQCLPASTRVSTRCVSRTWRRSLTTRAP
ncbi:MAG: hypothetical protein JNL45_01395 [Hyphomicrobium sp.]|nr:hypothetical protein [Hyphomicrobium sp.]